jgi:response regulator RpfG family c-di-GMP phosphodiesterase
MHVRRGEQIVQPIKELHGCQIRHHHERFDGKGYPDNLVGKDIPIGARIMPIVDSFDAMTTILFIEVIMELRPELIAKGHNIDVADSMIQNLI